MFIDNNWYGNRYILSKYCKIKNYPILCSLQHGLILASHFEITESKNLKLGKRRFMQFPWLVWNDFIVENTKKNNIINVINIGSPIIYLHTMLKNKKFCKPKGTLIIPCRSVYEVNHIVNYDSLIKMVKKKYNPPYKILVGYFDLPNVFKIRHKYKDCTFVTCGKRKNLKYTYKLYKYYQECQSTVNFYPGTSILYSLFFKKKTFYINNRYLNKTTKKPEAIRNNKIFKRNNIKKLKNKNMVNIKISDIAKDDKIATTCFKKEYGIDLFNLNRKTYHNKALIALGYNKKKSPTELKKILGWDSTFKITLSYILKMIMNIRYFNLTKINKF